MSGDPCYLILKNPKPLPELDGENNSPIGYIVQIEPITKRVDADRVIKYPETGCINTANLYFMTGLKVGIHLHDCVLTDITEEFKSMCSSIEKYKIENPKYKRYPKLIKVLDELIDFSKNLEPGDIVIMR